MIWAGGFATLLAGAVAACSPRAASAIAINTARAASLRFNIVKFLVWRASVVGPYTFASRAIRLTAAIEVQYAKMQAGVGRALGQKKDSFGTESKMRQDMTHFE
jgi:hypothetical protein